jgi:hypothetical protein
MQVFIDEFIAKMAEFYPTPSDMSPQYSSPQIEPRGLEQQLGALPRASEPQPLSTNHAS